ncbi:unnamed protein product [Didymodactylos carnosus]|uniref:Secretory carrier-associated membrane protein n=1 Tax=Didymodactylos carnosus TaxID=1234261 RepID=A0A813NU20_9BILA|nr:unnamed protein product [Didymodactylos carnosus]CAF3518803.1 unnamed protein product [Didymodactylos carnosus]
MQETSIQQATAQSRTNQQTLNEYNPFTNSSSAAPIDVTPQPAVLPSPPIVQPSYASVATPTVPPPTVPPPQQQQQTTTRVDLSQLERQQQELERREQKIIDKERELKTAVLGPRTNNFPPLPNFCPCKPCFYQNIGIEIPSEFQKWVRYLFYLWLIYSITLVLNIIGAIAYFVVLKEGGVTFGLSILYFILLTPCSYGLFLMISLFSRGGHAIGPAIVVMIVTICFAFIAIADFILLIQVHRLYRQTGASLEQAQRELQNAFVNNPTVRGAAAEAARQGVDSAINNGLNSQRAGY